MSGTDVEASHLCVWYMSVCVHVACVWYVCVFVCMCVTPSNSNKDSFPVGLSGRAFRADGGVVSPNQRAVGS